GYGRGTVTRGGKTITIEIRSLNSKFTDVRFKMPNNYKEKEHEFRKLITEKAQRGKLDMSLDIKSQTGDENFGLNLPLFRRYFHELTALSNELEIPQGDIIQAILRIPNVVGGAEDEIDEEEWKDVMEAMNIALTNFDLFRRTEGEAMEKDLRLRIKNILEALAQIDPFEKGRIIRLKNRLKQNLEEFLGKENVDENRFEQEVIFYLEKIDITEEKVRLEQHCKYFLEQLDLKTTQKGRKLSFISQEMGREINTLGAKAYSSDIQKLVVHMKDELEKIKEQVANSV
ncbi:MAG: YicC family protein, partial [Bacteroidetes bacterium]